MPVFQKHEKQREDFFNNIYYKTVKRQLIYIGQYPYQDTKSRSIYMFFLLFSIITLMIPQINRLSQVIGERDMDQIIMCLPPLFTNGGCFIKLFNLQINKKKFRTLFNLISDEWAALTRDDEIRVIKALTEEGSKFGKMYRNYVFSVLCMYMSLPLAPVVLDVVIPQNETRPRISLYEVDYLVDTNEYFYPIYIHSAWSSICTILILVTVDAMYMLITHHACGLFALCGCRITNLIANIEEDATEKCTEAREKLLHFRLKECVNSHRKAIEFVDFLASSSSTSYLLQIGINMIIISITGVQTVIKLHEIEETARYGVFTIAQGIHLFFNSLPGQKVLDYSGELDKVIYSTEWYKIPVKMQKILLTMQMRCKWPCKLTAGGLYDMNMENFGMIAKTSMSYFTMFLSIRE